MKVLAHAPGKINLLLKVGAPGPDGYHPLTTLFHCLDLHETVQLETGPGQGADTLHTRSALLGGKPAVTLPPDLDGPDNLVLRALALLRQYYAPTAPAVHATVTKRIPIQGGLAGGSADAVATLVGASQLWGLGLDREQLAVLGRKLGADVSYGLWGGNCLGTGHGDQLQALPAGPARHWVLAISRQGLSTPAVFRALDATGGLPPAPARLDPAWLRALEGAPEELAELLENDLQPVAFSLRPELGAVYHAGLDLGALGGVLSGSGPTLAFLVSDRLTGEALAAQLRQLPAVGAALVTRSTARAAWAGVAS